MICFVMPTRNRPERLGKTLKRLGRLTIDAPAELVVADNASDEPVTLPATLPNGIACRVVRLKRNAGAAARNAAVDAASPDADWIVMLDDDSHPVETVEPFAETIKGLGEQPETVAAVMADIHLPAQGCREAGGLPEVFVGCGVAIRREAFTDVGGYDPSFGYYVEEYDLAARMLGRGWSIGFDPAFRVDHHKIGAGRDMDLILQRLVRNNCWVMQRYAPLPLRREMLCEQRKRYRRIAQKEHARDGYARGLAELRQTLRQQPRRPLLCATWDRFTGLGHARAALNHAWRERPFVSAAIVDHGKNAWAVERALAEIAREAGLSVVDSDSAEVLIVGTMSPGPMLDALERRRATGRRVIAPWRGADAVATRAAPGRSRAA